MKKLERKFQWHFDELAHHSIKSYSEIQYSCALFGGNWNSDCGDSLTRGFDEDMLKHVRQLRG